MANPISTRPAPASVLTTAPLSRMMNVSTEAAAAAAHDSANPDLGFLTDLVAELGIGKQLPVPAAPETAAPAPVAAEPATDDPTAQPEPATTEPPAAEPATTEPAATEPTPTEPAAPAEPAPVAAPDPLAEIRTSFETKLAALQQELAALRQAPVAPAPAPAAAPEAALPAVPAVRIDDRLLLAESPEALDALSAEYGAIVDRCLENPEGFEVAPSRAGEAPRFVGPEETRRLLVESNRLLRQIPIRARELAISATDEAQAEGLYPGFKDSNSLESRTYRALVSLAPQLRRLPNLRTFIGDAVAHEQVRRQTTAPAPAAATPPKIGPTGKPLPGQPVARPATPPAVPPPPARAPASAATTSAVKKQELMRRQASGQGGSDNLIALVDALLPQPGARRAS